MNYGQDTPSAPVAAQPMTPAPSQPYLHVKIGQLERNRKLPSLRFDVTTNLPNFKRKKYTAIERNYGEIEKLRQHLVQTYPECLIPVLPAGTAATATSSSGGGPGGVIHVNGGNRAGPTATFNTTAFEEEALVKEAIHTFLARIANHPVLRSDYELREFIEAPFLSRTGFQHAIEHIDQLDGLELGSDTWYDALGAYMAKVETRLDPVRKSAGQVARKRKALSEGLQDFATKNVAISVTEPHAELSLILRKTGNRLHRVSEVQQLQAEHESMRLDYFMDIQIRSTEAFLDALVSRQQIYYEYDTSTKRTERKKQNIMVLKSASSIQTDRADQALEDFEQAKTDQTTRLQVVERINTTLPSDLQNAQRQRVHDFQTWLKGFAKRQLEFEKQQLTEWTQLAEQLSKPQVQKELLLANGHSAVGSH
ncbi:Vacuolar protein sorting-associated protein 17 [Tieghemiomyces parasiticus]|uniref:Vacuolar protein sorting-associated protein 17 n=1 Tax=Tieghemiomyces parasiticus TaxID=78921 RepID=A0A9W8DSZ3_9FUNG|nr:Vacuolar protein sorting-associated protein 17 [Tieghemiomyces parasiticus]